ncbi:MAG: peptidase S1 [Chthoniobacteraceae bacterium]
MLNDGDPAEHQQTPPNGAPWRHAAQVGLPDGSGVYLGKRFILTANHVAHIDAGRLNGRHWKRDTRFKPKRIGGEDLKLIRIAGDPGLPRLPLIGPRENVLSRRCTVIGWGLGAGASLAERGWRWGDIRTKRWGLNTTLPKLVERPDGLRVATVFDRDARETSLANADSGCGLFIRFSGVWKLAAIGIDVDDQNDTFFDRDPAAPGHQPTRSYYIPLREWRTAIDAIIDGAAP